MKEEDEKQDISFSPGANSDLRSEIEKHIRREVLNLYDVYSYRHAAAILNTSFASELKEIENALLNFRITKKDIGLPGGNESIVPKHFSERLRPSQWKETRIQGDLLIRVFKQKKALSKDGVIKDIQEETQIPMTLENYIDGHKIDYVKGRVALDLEWNSKDQTFDRDLYAFRMFHECGIISAAVIITRSEKLNPVFDKLPLLKKDGSIDCDKDGTAKTCKQKYGADSMENNRLGPQACR